MEIELNSTSKIIKSSRLGVLFIYEREVVPILYYLDERYHKRVLLQNVIVDNFWVIENGAEAKCSSHSRRFNIEKNIYLPFHGVVAISRNKVIICSDRMLRIYTHPFGVVKALIGRRESPK